jgi:predicted enzyme related to lactoylglutathione lyase
MLEDVPGQIRWIDLTVRDAPAIREFYEAVVGWKSSPVAMGEYSDWCMAPEGIDDPVAGVCHARGGNVGLPPTWLIYITVADLVGSMAACRDRGGEVVFGPKNFGPEGTWCVIRDPAGAYAALFEPKAVA